jgi:hypothetical protein
MIGAAVERFDVGGKVAKIAKIANFSCIPPSRSIGLNIMPRQGFQPGRVILGRPLEHSANPVAGAFGVGDNGGTSRRPQDRPMTPHEFAAKWKKAQLTERASYQQCRTKPFGRNCNDGTGGVDGPNPPSASSAAAVSHESDKLAETHDAPTVQRDRM